MKKLQKSDLQIGDILIFEDFKFDLSTFLNKYAESKEAAFYYLLHYLIAWFDPGKEGDNYRNIYHAAIWGNVDFNRDKGSPIDCVVQAGSKGIGASTLEDTLAHKAVMNVYVCRIKEKTPDFHDKINKSIRNFYEHKGKYSFETAWLLAAICSMRYSKGVLHKLIEKSFGKNYANYIIERILYYINEFNDRSQREMITCSPLVAMMYKNAGYELAVNVFELLKELKLPKPKFNLDGLEELNLAMNLNTSNNWPPIKETVVTPRQLLESPDVELIGYLQHKE